MGKKRVRPHLDIGMTESRAGTNIANEIADLEGRVTDLGAMVQSSISRVITALLLQDAMMARAVISEDEAIDCCEVEIHESCLSILQEVRPRDGDLRFVVAVMKINDSLERMGDLTENVAEAIVEVGDWERFLRVKGIEDLAYQAQNMVKDVLTSLVQRDAELARQVIRVDDRADAIYAQIKSRIEFELDRIPENANPLLKLEYITRQFERIADIATNIAEEVIYLVEGKVVRHLKNI